MTDETKIEFTQPGEKEVMLEELDYYVQYWQFVRDNAEKIRDKAVENIETFMRLRLKLARNMRDYPELM